MQRESHLGVLDGWDDVLIDQDLDEQHEEDELRYLAKHPQPADARRARVIQLVDQSRGGDKVAQVLGEEVGRVLLWEWNK